MFIITDKTEKAVIGFGARLDYMSNGYPRLMEEDIAYPTHMVDVFEIEALPVDFIIGKYCYTEAEGFYINPDWVEPDPTNTYGIPDETYHAIINDLTSEVANSGY